MQVRVLPDAPIFLRGLGYLLVKTASNMAKVIFTIVTVLAIGVLVLISPFVYLGLKSRSQMRALQSRSDYPQIVSACVTLARSVTNHSLIMPCDSRVPPLLRSLSPRYLTAESNSVRLEFHGGFDHYGYRVEQSDTNSKLWTISWYTEKTHRLLSTISLD